MKVVSIRCPSCSAGYDGPIKSGLLTCEYCGTRFAFDAKELESMGLLEEETFEEAEEQEELPLLKDFAEEACQKFFDKVGYDEFKYTDTIAKGLGIDDYEDVFLIHDDTLFNTGKNGFAITDYGFYCREMGEGEAHYLRWGDFAECGKPFIDGSLIKADGVSVAYFTGDSNVRDELCSLYRKFRKYAKKFDWV